MAVLGFLIDLPSFIKAKEDVRFDEEYHKNLARTIIIKAAELVTVTVPPALPTCMQIGVSIALGRLKKKQTFCISPTKINEAGRVNVMCFDKTGTLTEDGLDLLGVRPINYSNHYGKLGFRRLVRDVTVLSEVGDARERDVELNHHIRIESASNKNSLYSIAQMLPSELMLEIMATCHSLTLVQNKMIGDPLDLKMFEATKWSFEENEMQKFDATIVAVVKPSSDKDFALNKVENVKDGRAIGIVRRFDFSSKLQRMSSIVKNLDEAEYKIHMKGSPEKIRELCDPTSVPGNFHTILAKYTEEGYRVLACASKTVGTNYRSLMAAKREELEVDLNFIGFLIMENKLKPITTSIIDMLHHAEIRTVMVTGDNALTAISVARQCHIVGHNQRIFLGDISEHKVKGKNAIVWKDFEFSEYRLNDDLEPETEIEKQPLKGVDESVSPIRKTSRGGPEQLEMPNEVQTPNFRGEDIDFGIVDLDPPFFNLRDREEYCIAITGKAYSMILEEAQVHNNPKYTHILQKLMKKCLVFARMHPDEKASMITNVRKNRKNTVGMCGDGANDVGALKAANVGVSLSEAEASIAAPFTSKIQDISCIPNLLREARSALATSYQAFKFMALYSIIQFTSVTIMYYNIVEFSNWHYYHIDLGIILPLSATMAMSQTYEHLTRFKPTGRLISVQILSSVLGQAFIQMIFQLILFVLLLEEISSDGDMKDKDLRYICVFGQQTVCIKNSTLYLISIYQYLAVALAFIVGKPFRKSFYTNIFFTVTLIILLVFNLAITYNPYDWRLFEPPMNTYANGTLIKPPVVADYYNLNAVIPLPMTWKATIVFVAGINAFVTIFWERVVVRFVSLKWKQHRDNKEIAREDDLSLFTHQDTNETAPGRKVNEMSLAL